VLGTFCMKRLVPLRAMAITSNLAFVLYGYAAGIEPVLVLHLILLPVNALHLLEALGKGLPAVDTAAVERYRPGTSRGKAEPAHA